jgi:hypothetical protein
MAECIGFVDESFGNSGQTKYDVRRIIQPRAHWSPLIKCPFLLVQLTICTTVTIHSGCSVCLQSGLEPISNRCYSDRGTAVSRTTSLLLAVAVMKVDIPRIYWIFFAFNTFGTSHLTLARDLEDLGQLPFSLQSTFLFSFPYRSSHRAPIN